MVNDECQETNREKRVPKANSKQQKSLTMKKNCLITGIYGNLGSAVARTFSEAGYTVWGTARPGESGEKDPQIMTGDLTRQDAVEEMMATLKRNLNHMDVVVCTVGGFSARDVADLQLADVQRMIELNFHTAFYISKGIYDWMRGRGPVHFFFIGAKPVLEPDTGTGASAYTLSKSLLFHWADLLNAKGKSDRIRATVIVPGVIDTPQNRQAMPDADTSAWVTPEAIAETILFTTHAAGERMANRVIRMY